MPYYGTAWLPFVQATVAVSVLHSMATECLYPSHAAVQATMVNLKCHGLLNKATWSRLCACARGPLNMVGYV